MSRFDRRLKRHGLPQATAPKPQATAGALPRLSDQLLAFVSHYANLGVMPFATIETTLHIGLLCWNAGMAPDQERADQEEQAQQMVADLLEPRALSPLQREEIRTLVRALIALRRSDEFVHDRRAIADFEASARPNGLRLQVREVAARALQGSPRARSSEPDHGREPASPARSVASSLDLVDHHARKLVAQRAGALQRGPGDLRTPKHRNGAGEPPTPDGLRPQGANT